MQTASMQAIKWSWHDWDGSEEAHVRETEGVAQQAGGEQRGDDGLEAIGNIPGGEAVAHAREQCHPLSLVAGPHLEHTHHQL